MFPEHTSRFFKLFNLGPLLLLLSLDKRISQDTLRLTPDIILVGSLAVAGRNDKSSRRDRR